jgi:hypothetical protein
MCGVAKARLVLAGGWTSRVQELDRRLACAQSTVTR